MLQSKIFSLEKEIEEVDRNPENCMHSRLTNTLINLNSYISYREKVRNNTRKI